MEIVIHNPNNLPKSDYRTWKPLQGNLKDLTESNYNKLKNVLLKRGYTVPAFLWRHEGELYIIDAHQRQRVMLKENMQPYEVPYILIEAETEAEAKAQLLEISSQYGTITQEGFDTFTAELPEADLANLHFDGLSDIFREPESDIVEDVPPDVSTEPAVSKLGEIYQLGKHRLMCGDSTDFGQVTDLMDGKEADMVFTDPPWRVNYIPEDQPKHRKMKPLGGIQNDDMDDAEWISFLRSFEEVIFDTSKAGASLYIFMGQSEMPLLCDILTDRFHRSDTLIWKKHWQFGRSDYQRAYEPFWFGWKKGATHYFTEDRTQTDVWEISKGDTNAYIHPTQKPVELCGRAVENSSRTEEIVLDLFGGSGSTLIACEQLDRICYTIELDPKYCDVIRKRYWKFTHLNGEEGWEEGTKAINHGEFTDHVNESTEPATVPAG